MANNTSASNKVLVLKLASEGLGIRAIERFTGVHKNTVSGIITRVGNFCLRQMDDKFRGLDLPEVEADEIHSFVQRKTQLSGGVGIVWTYIALDRKTKLIPAFHVGSRKTKDAIIFFKKLNKTLSSTCELSTDCLKSYVSAIAKTPNGYEGNKNNIDLIRARYFGKKLGRGITNQVETHNGILRQRCSRLARRGKGFSKRIDHLKAHLALYFFHYNFIKNHSAIKMTPAQAAKISDGEIEWMDVLRMSKEINHGKFKVKNLNHLPPKLHPFVLSWFLKSVVALPQKKKYAPRKEKLSCL